MIGVSRKRLVRLACLAVAAGSVTASPEALAAVRPVVTGAVQVTSNPNPVRAHATPLIARSPKGGVLAVAEVDVAGRRECAVHISADDGRSWSRGGTLMVEPFTDCSIGAEFGSHVMPFFDRNGVLYVVTTANDPKDMFEKMRVGTPEFPRVRSFVPRNVYLSRSIDDGRTFSTRLVFEAPRDNPHQGYNYAPVGAVDPNDPRYIYVGWAQGDWQSNVEPGKAVVAASSNAGESFAPPFDISDKQGSEHPWISVGRSGVVHATYWSKGHGTPSAVDPTKVFPNGPRNDPAPIFHMRSSDHGKTWARQQIDPGNQRWYRPPVVAADPTSDAVYVAWNSVSEPRNFEMDRDGKARTDIYLLASTDDGKTWQPRRTVNDDANGPANQVLPNLSVAPNGRLDIAWDDFRHSPKPGASPGNEVGIDEIYYTSSTDQGRTFAPAMRVNDRSIDRSRGVWSNGIRAQVAVGIASANEGVYFAWQEPRNSDATTNSEDVYAASVRLSEPARASASSGANWGLLVAGVVLGMGLGIVAAWTLYRRSTMAAAV